MTSFLSGDGKVSLGVFTQSTTPKDSQVIKKMFAEVTSEAFDIFKTKNKDSKGFFEIIFDDFFGKFISLLTRLASGLILRAVDAAGNVIYRIKDLLDSGRKIAGMTAKGGDIASKFLTSGYGMRWGRMHNGVDIAGGPWVQGVEMSVIKPGTVVDLDSLQSGWGNFVVIKHDDGYYSLYGHMDSIAVSKGQRIENKDGAATVIGTMGNTGASQGAHLHFELGTGWNGGVITGHINPINHIDKFVRAGGDVTVEEAEKPKAPTGKFDIIIPLDHVPSNMAGRFPDNERKNTFKQSRATGADGREREYQDSAASKLKAKLEAKGYTVGIVKPESYSSYETYDAYIEKMSKKGVRILPLHFDAARSGGGTGFLTRTRAGDAEDAAFAAPIQKALEKFQRENKNLGNISSDTQSNATVNRGAASATALIELGVMVDWERIYGKDFTGSSKFDSLLQDVADAIEKGTPKRPETPSVQPTQQRRNRRGRLMSANTEPPASTQTQKAQEVARSYDEDQTTQVIAMVTNSPQQQQIMPKNTSIVLPKKSEVEQLSEYSKQLTAFSLGSTA